MISKEEYFGLKPGDTVQDEDGKCRWHVLYARPTSRPEEKQVVFESPTGDLRDTTMIGDEIFDTDLMTRVPGLNGENVKLLPEKNAMLA